MAGSPRLRVTSASGPLALIGRCPRTWSVGKTGNVTRVGAYAARGLRAEPRQNYASHSSRITTAGKTMRNTEPWGTAADADSPPP